MRCLLCLGCIVLKKLNSSERMEQKKTYIV